MSNLDPRCKVLLGSTRPAVGSSDRLAFLSLPRRRATEGGAMYERELDIRHRGALTEIIWTGALDADGVERVKEAVEIGLMRGSTSFWIDARKQDDDASSPRPVETEPAPSGRTQRVCEGEYYLG